MRKGENIHLRKDGRYEARFFDTNKKKYTSVYGRSYSEAKRKRNAIKSTITADKALKKPFTNKNAMLEKELTDWLDKECLNVKRSTFSNYYDKMYNHILPFFAKINKNDVNQELIDSFIKTKLTHGRIDGKGGLSPKTVKDITNVLKQFFDCNKMFFEYTVKQDRNKKIRILSDEEYYRFLSFLLLAPDTSKLGMLLTLFCGLRLGELCALKWDCIDLTNKIIHIRYTLQRIKNTDESIPTKTIVIIDTPKSAKSVRDIPIVDFLYNILINFKGKDNCYLLTGNKNYIEPRSCQKNFKTLLKRAGIQDINFHAMRHTFATKSTELGMDAKTLSEILGHADVRFTMGCYVHSNIEIKRKELEKVCKII